MKVQFDLTRNPKIECRHAKTHFLPIAFGHVSQHRIRATQWTLGVGGEPLIDARTAEFVPARKSVAFICIYVAETDGARIRASTRAGFAGALVLLNVSIRTGSRQIDRHLGSHGLDNVSDKLFVFRDHF